MIVFNQLSFRSYILIVFYAFFTSYRFYFFTLLSFFLKNLILDFIPFLSCLSIELGFIILFKIFFNGLKLLFFDYLYNLSLLLIKCFLDLQLSLTLLLTILISISLIFVFLFYWDILLYILFLVVKGLSSIVSILY